MPPGLTERAAGVAMEEPDLPASFPSMTPGRDAFLQLVGVLLATGLLRAGCAPRIPAEDALPGTAVDPSALADSARVLAGDSERRSRPLGPGERLDPNRAPEAELDRLPGVGPGLARAIVAARDSAPFRSLDDLVRVRGIGASTLEKIRPGVEVRGNSGTAAGTSAVGRGVSGSRRPLLPGSSLAGAGVSRDSPTPSPGVLDLNRAGAGELESLPGVGPVLAGRIVEERDRRGGFRTVGELVEVKGIGPALLERLRGRLRTGSGR
jgi:competence ComEA-like helix-hairpin-helix protein